MEKSGALPASVSCGGTISIPAGPVGPRVLSFFFNTSQLQPTGQHANKHHAAHAHFLFIPPLLGLFLLVLSLVLLGWSNSIYPPPSRLQNTMFLAWSQKCARPRTDWRWMELCTHIKHYQTSLRSNRFIWTRGEDAVPSCAGTGRINSCMKKITSPIGQSSHQRVPDFIKEHVATENAPKPNDSCGQTNFIFNCYHRNWPQIE